MCVYGPRTCSLCGNKWHVLSRCANAPSATVIILCRNARYTEAPTRGEVCICARCGEVLSRDDKEKVD
jgi:hypothetical protein